MEAFLKTMEKSLKTYGEGIVKQLSIKYGFDLIEGQEVLETSKPKKVEKVEKEKKEKKEPQKRGRKPKKDSVSVSVDDGENEKSKKKVCRPKKEKSGEVNANAGNNYDECIFASDCYGC